MIFRSQPDEFAENRAIAGCLEEFTTTSVLKVAKGQPSRGESIRFVKESGDKNFQCIAIDPGSDK
jgi:hypothetical protein